jgi:hypothetical protein
MPALALFALSLLLPAQGTEPRIQEGLALVVDFAAADSEEQKVEIAHRIAGFRYEPVALAVIQLLDDPSMPAAVVRELEWTLVAMEDKAFGPLSAAVADDMLPEDMVVSVLTRIARRNPEAVVALLAQSAPAFSRIAALALGSCGREEALKLLMASLPDVPPEAAAPVLHSICRLSRLSCAAALRSALASPHEALQNEALSLVAASGDRTLIPACLPLLHSDRPALIRAVLDTLATVGADGGESDLEILFSSSAEEIRELVVRTLGATPTDAARTALQRIARENSRQTRAGRLADELFRRAADKTVVVETRDANHPAQAVIVVGPKSAVGLALYSEEGFRVVARGSLLWKCRGQRGQERRIGHEDFLADATVPLPKCGSNPVPQAFWRRQDGRQITAELPDQTLD